ncbi:PEP-CTERM sorting domain-containing protein [Methyloversatilis sp.]|uniref:PEP-CTERM sorting domain-containing protein n=1 Tax=Methyloversatilis sp. TaxID=2569862 RepID=UPI00273343A6|nr:PEP-CTERM sorting domain-containing protein [Methyloversatilis sp.]MDP3577264.1 PEP-CTERM sorting domain-containing protein [Methyloversatilis sp.]
MLDQPLLVTDQNGVSTASQLRREVFAPTNTGGVPNFLLTGNAHALALPGSLHASVTVAVSGTGGAFVPGISGYGYAAVEDRIRIRSSTLADGTAVTLSTVFNITGIGEGTLYVNVAGRRNGIETVLFGDTESSNSALRSIAGMGGSFIAYIGETLGVDYSLRASTGVSTAAWRADEVANGRMSQSTYGNSAYLYFASADPAVDVYIDGVGGYDYVLPPAIPEPHTALLMLLGLTVVGAGARRRRHDSPGSGGAAVFVKRKASGSRPIEEPWLKTLMQVSGH